MWRIEGGVVTIPFVKEKVNVVQIVQYTDEFIIALETCRR